MGLQEPTPGEGAANGANWRELARLNCLGGKKGHQLKSGMKQMKRREL